MVTKNRVIALFCAFIAFKCLAHSQHTEDQSHSTGLSEVNPFIIQCQQNKTSDPGIYTINALKKQFSIADCEKLYSHLKKIKSLTFADTQAYDMKPLTHFTQIENLDLSGMNLFNDLKSLKGLHNLRQLDLSHTDISEISEIKFFPHLIHLKLLGTKISKISSLRFLFNLKYLDISYTRVDSISELYRLRQLIKINLQGTNVNRHDIQLFSEQLPHTFLVLDPIDPTKINCQQSITQTKEMTIRLTNSSIKKIRIRNIRANKKCSEGVECYTGSLGPKGQISHAYLAATHKKISIRIRQNQVDFDLIGHCREGWIAIEGHFSSSMYGKKIDSGKFFSISKKIKVKNSHQN